ncbi:hypothetical protein ACS0TY_019162 [Phlomoides rotata]
MALSEARAAWQRTANRCFVQEDAKRAPKLACCPTVPSSVKQADPGPNRGQNVPSTIYVPSNLNVSYSNLSPSSKWWLYVQPNCGYQKDSMDEQFNSVEGGTGTLARSEEDPAGLIGQSITKHLSCEKTEFGVKEEEFVTFSTWNCQDPLKVEDVGDLKVEADSKSSWIEVDKNTPWWRTADMDELASFVAQSSLDHLENCDLPRPQNAHLKKDVDSISCSAHDGIPGSLLDTKLGTGTHYHHNAHLHTASACQKLEGHSLSGADETSRDTPTHERMLEMDNFGNDATKAQLMEALRHSQTRAREAEIAANQACAEKEHVVKLVFRQASQLFAYKQWLKLLQLETMYLQFINNTSQSVSTVLPPVLPWKPQRTRKIRKNSDTSSSRKWACPQYDASKYAVVFALGLGLAGAGFLLGWTFGWMLPTW